LSQGISTQRLAEQIQAHLSNSQNYLKRFGMSSGKKSTKNKEKKVRHYQISKSLALKQEEDVVTKSLKVKKISLFN